VRKSGLAQSTFVAESQFRYFDAKDIKRLFTLGDIHDSKIMREFNEIHAKDRKTYPKLTKHIQNLMEMGIIGISDNDLLYSKHEVHVDVLNEDELIALTPRKMKMKPILLNQSTDAQTGKKSFVPAPSSVLFKKNLVNQSEMSSEYKEFLRSES
jgi:hypothetical protein